MHIALVTHHYAPEVGAPQRRWGALVPRFTSAGHRVTVLTPPPHYPAGRAVDLPPELRPGARTVGEHGEEILRVRFREHGPGLVSRTLDQSVAAADSVRRAVGDLGRRAGRPDVVVATVPGIPSIFAGLGLRHLLGVPLVVEMRDAWPDLIEPANVLGRRDGWRNGVTAVVHRAMTRVQRDAAAVVTTTAAFGDVLRRRGVRHVEVIRNGVYLEEVPHLGQRVRAPGEPLRILYLGTVGRAQGLEHAVRAAATLQRSGTPVDLRIVGPGVDYPLLLDVGMRTDAPLDLRGAVGRDQVLDHYRWADTLLVPLRAWAPLRWTVPSKLYELLATGRHITAAVAGEAADIVRSTRAGDVVPPEDAAALVELWGALAADPGRLTASPLAPAWAKEHGDYDRLAERYLEVLEGVRVRRRAA